MHNPGQKGFRIVIEDGPIGGKWRGRSPCWIPRLALVGMQMARGLPCDFQLLGKLYFKLFYGVWSDLLAWLNLGNIGERNMECREPWHWPTCRTHGLVKMPPRQTLYDSYLV